MKTYVKTFSKSDREALASLAGTTEGYLFQLAGNHRKPSALLSKKLEIASKGLLTRAELRPDLFT